MQEKCFCGGALSGRIIEFGNPLQECQECGTKYVNKRMLETLRKERERKKYLF